MKVTNGVLSEFVRYFVFELLDVTGLAHTLHPTPYTLNRMSCLSSSRSRASDPKGCRVLTISNNMQPTL